MAIPHVKPIYAHNVIINVNCFNDVLKLEVIKCQLVSNVSNVDRPMCVDILVMLMLSYM